MTEKQVCGKMLLEGVIHCLTGLHIGGNKEVSEIGGVDLLVIRDALTREPYIPGSSLKGKLRSLLERYHFARDPAFEFNRKMDIGGLEIRHHECGREECAVCRLFGASRARDDVPENLPASLYVRDAYLTEESKERLLQMESGYYLSEVKFENTLDRITCYANPRQIERVPRGARFRFQMVYNLWRPRSPDRLQEDVAEIFTGLKLLVDDYLGGHGSRGYGQIGLEGLALTWRSLAYYQGKKEEKKLAAKERQPLAAFAEEVQGWLAELE